MKWVLLGMGAAVLGGCAMSPQRANDLVQAAPEWEVCYVAVSGKGQQVMRQAVYAEIERRRIDCNQHMPMVLARMQQDGINAANANAQAQLGLQMMNAARPRPAAPMSPQVVCRSVNMGTYVRTVCD